MAPTAEGGGYSSKSQASSFSAMLDASTSASSLPPFALAPCMQRANGGKAEAGRPIPVVTTEAEPEASDDAQHEYNGIGTSAAAPVEAAAASTSAKTGGDQDQASAVDGMAEADRGGAAGGMQVDDALEEAWGGEQSSDQMREDENGEENAEEGADGAMRFEVLSDDAWSVALPVRSSEEHGRQ